MELRFPWTKTPYRSVEQVATLAANRTLLHEETYHVRGQDIQTCVRIPSSLPYYRVGKALQVYHMRYGRWRIYVPGDNPWEVLAMWELTKKERADIDAGILTQLPAIQRHVGC